MSRNASFWQVGLLDVALFRISWQIPQFHKLTPYSCHILFLTIPLHLQFISSTTTAPTCTLHSVLFTKDWASIHQKHGNNRTKTDHLFKALSKCNSKFDCLVYAMLYIKDIKPSLNTQADSIRAKLFTWQLRTFFIFFIIFFSLIVFLTLGIIPIGPANILCIASNFIYSFLHFITLYFFTFQLDNGVTYRRNVVHFLKCFLNVF